jgi:nitroreductase
LDIFDVIKKRKSVRRYKSVPVEKEKIEQIITAAQLAPSWRNGQCWKFIVVVEPQIKQEVIRCTGTFNQSWLGKEYAIIVACGDPQKSGARFDKAYYLVDVAIAMQNMVLAATALGLGTCWIGTFDENKLTQILNIPENYRVVAITPLGYPAKKEGIVGHVTRQVIRSNTRKPLSEVFVMNKWE